MPPTRAVASTDIPERCQIGIGQYGYMLANGQPVKFRAQHARFPENMLVVTNDDYMSGRDYDYFSLIHIRDFRRGQGQVGFSPQDPISKARYYQSKNIDIRDEGRAVITRAIATTGTASPPVSATCTPLRAVGGFMYAGDSGKVQFHADWTAAPSTANTSAAGLVSALADDGQFVYGVVDGVGINKWTIGSGSAGTLFNNTSTAYKRILWANRLLFAISAAVLYSINPAGTSTVLFTPPTGWTLQDISQKRGGAVDAPILVLATSGDRSFVWYWDGTLIHDYLELPPGFIGYRLKFYLGNVFINGVRAMANGTYKPCAYYIENDRLGFLAYFGTEQANGDPTEDGVNSAVACALESYDRNIFFLAAKASGGSEVWTYSIVNGGVSRWHLGAAATPSDIAIYRGGPWVSYLSTGVHKTFQTFMAS